MQETGPPYPCVWYLGLRREGGWVRLFVLRIQSDRRRLPPICAAPTSRGAASLPTRRSIAAVAEEVRPRGGHLRRTRGVGVCLRVRLHLLSALLGA